MQRGSGKGDALANASRTLNCSRNAVWEQGDRIAKFARKVRDLISSLCGLDVGTFHYLSPPPPLSLPPTAIRSWRTDGKFALRRRRTPRKLYSQRRRDDRQQRYCQSIYIKLDNKIVRMSFVFINHSFVCLARLASGRNKQDSRLFRPNTSACPLRQSSRRTAHISSLPTWYFIVRYMYIL